MYMYVCKNNGKDESKSKQSAMFVDAVLLEIARHNFLEESYHVIILEVMFSHRHKSAF